MVRRQIHGSFYGNLWWVSVAPEMPTDYQRNGLPMTTKTDPFNQRMASRIELWSLDRLQPYAGNARTHNEAQIDQIAASITEFGFNNPILVDSKDGIVAGHGRLLAAQKLGLLQVPVVVLDHLTDTQRRAYVIADNKLAELAGWDEDLLAGEVSALAAEDFDLSLVGFTDEEITALLDWGHQEEAVEEIPEVPVTPVSRPGDLWLLGHHRVLCGDATQLAHVERLLDGHKADMVFADPPYNVDYSGGPDACDPDRKIANDNLGGEFGVFLLDACRVLMTVTSGAMYVCMSSSEIDTLKSAFTAAGGHWSTFLIWAKDHFTLGRSDYQRQYEPILYGWPEGESHHWCGDRDQGDVWFVDKPRVNDLHPTMKPVELVEKAITNSSLRGGLVLDTFGGSGSTLIAAERIDRCARLLELDPRYVDVIIRRWQEVTGREAVLDGDGCTFNVVTAERLADE